MEAEKDGLLAADTPTVAIDVILWIRRYGVHILLVFAMAVLAIELYNFWQVSKMRKVQQAWVALQSASSPGAIEESVLTVYHVPRVTAQAYLKIGRIYLLRLTLGSGVNKTLGLKATRAQALAGAKKAFEKVIHQYPRPMINKIAAELGLAQVYEDSHQWKKAAAIYHAIILSKSNPTAAAFAGLAKFHLDNLRHWAEPILLGPDINSGGTTTAPATTPPAMTQPKKAGGGNTTQ